MKSILIIAAGLMTAASIYGLADYASKKDKPEFRKLYHENEGTGVQRVERKETPTTAVEKKEETPAKTLAVKKSVKKTPKNKRVIESEMFSRAKPVEKEVKLQ